MDFLRNNGLAIASGVAIGFAISNILNNKVRSTSRSTSEATLPGAVDLARGRSLLPYESKQQEACAATHVVSNVDSKMYDAAICTHSGSFHCDEALAIGLLKLLPKWRDAPVIRSRDKKIIPKCAMAVDVGGTHDHEKCQYDHHQKEFNAEYEDITLGASNTGFKTKLSSAGLVYKYYGKEILDEVRKSVGAPEESAALSDKIWKKMYSGFIEHVDGIDNGIEAFEGGTPNYSVSSTLSLRVGRLNPAWNQESSNTTRNELFQKAMLLTQKEFLDMAIRLYTDWMPARSIVERALDGSAQKYGQKYGGEADPKIDSQIFVLSEPCPWKDHLFDLEKEKNIVGQYIYCLSPNADGSTSINAVPIAPNSFTSRKALPKPWRALRDEKLSTLNKIEGSVFVHNSGFCGGNLTFDGAMAMARAAIRFEEE